MRFGLHHQGSIISGGEVDDLNRLVSRHVLWDSDIGSLSCEGGIEGCKVVLRSYLVEIDIQHRLVFR